MMIFQKSLPLYISEFEIKRFIEDNKSIVIILFSHFVSLQNVALRIVEKLLCTSSPVKSSYFYSQGGANGIFYFFESPLTA